MISKGKLVLKIIVYTGHHQAMLWQTYVALLTLTVGLEHTIMGQYKFKETAAERLLYHAWTNFNIKYKKVKYVRPEVDEQPYVVEDDDDDDVEYDQHVDYCTVVNY
ncbi:uncharacterized protein LOC125240753 [Leguminivora glycinivorella]|uniref:uncharacterized protein LOC125240753 n=1 Tax=Leguminivora glycinivorella TaxID=1035111 RepID=UPI00200E7C28|nr:uncharacterized protein LOC125240753 [Leguminivora glycinivorella]